MKSLVAAMVTHPAPHVAGAWAILKQINSGASVHSADFNIVNCDSPIAPAGKVISAEAK